MVNPFLIFVILAVGIVATVVYRQTKNLKKTVLAVAITVVFIFGAALIADQFME